MSGRSNKIPKFSKKQNKQSKQPVCDSFYLFMATY